MPAPPLAPECAWHDALFDMLWAPVMPAAFAEKGWAVYRNSTQRACLEALRANFPALSVLLGEAASEMLFRAYMKRHPPDDARLIRYGGQMASFLEGFEPARKWPHWVDVAGLDWAWLQAHVAPDAPALSPQDVAQAGSAATQMICPPHPATHWRVSDSAPIARLWQNALLGQPPAPDLPWHGEALMLTRTDQGVQGQVIGRAAVAFLEACADRKTLEQALGEALGADPQADLSALIACMLHSGALRREANGMT